MRWQSTGGIDYYRAHYNSDRPQFLGAAPIHRFDLTQSTMAGYWQQTVTVVPSTDFLPAPAFSGRKFKRPMR